MKLDTLQPEFVPWKLKTRDLLDNEINHVYTNLRLDKNGKLIEFILYLIFASFSTSSLAVRN